MSTLGTRTIPASQARVGQWIVKDNPRYNERIVDVSETRDGQIRLHVDYGNGGEPSTLFYEKDERIAVM